MKHKLQGKRFVPVFVALMAVSTALALWQRGSDKNLQLIAERIVDDGTRLVLTQSDDPAFEAFLSLVDTNGATRWRKGIYKLVDPELLGTTVGKKIVTIRAGDTRGNYETHAFGRQDGAFIWRGGRIKEPAPVVTPSERAGDTITEYYGPPVNLRIRLSAINGDLLASDPL